MAITLTVEDGSIVPNANTFVTIAEVRAFATQRGIDSLPADDDALSSLIINACDFVNTYEPRFQGSRTDPANQSLCFPRKCVEIYDTDLGENTIPNQLKVAQIQVTVAASTGIELFPTQTGANVTRETIGPITTEYQKDTWNASDLPVFSNVESSLNPLFQNSNGELWRTVRV